MIGVRDGRCEVCIECSDWAEIEPGEMAERCGEVVARAFPDAVFPVVVLFTDNDEMQSLNRQFRDRDGATNVLSFPPGEAVLPEYGYLGDIALGYEICRAQAGDAGVSLRDHAAHLLIHGMLHLIGYDHQTDEEAAAMEAHERVLLNRLGISDPYGGVQD